MSKRNLEFDSKLTSNPDSTLQKPKVISSQKVDRLGSKTAPIETEFVK